MRRNDLFNRLTMESLLIKPAGPDCNLSCDYCFYREKAALFPAGGAKRMSLEVLEETVRQALDQGGRTVNFGWQGGEPTLMGLDFFRRAVEFEERHGRGQNVANGLQTNGLLLDLEWADFLRQYHFLAGLS
ncbi:MAG: radical SAM protein, partial [Candidatus Aminicenantes bacterium]|nr:radical SAM protein [Candidatus Aminicenantes bacterium]